MYQRTRYVIGGLCGASLMTTGLLVQVARWRVIPLCYDAAVGWAATNMDDVAEVVETVGASLYYAGLFVACAVLLAWVVAGGRAEGGR